MKKNAKIKAALATLLLALVFVASSCREKGAAGGGERLSLKMGKVNSQPLISPLVQIALERGYFDAYGLDIDIQVIDRMGAFEALAVGKLDFVTFELIPELTMGGQGSDLSLFAGTQSGGMSVMANKDVAEDVREISSWKGRTIGVKLLSTSEMVSKFVLSNKYGFKIDDEVKYKFFEGDEPLIAATVRGDVDIAFISANWVETAVAQGMIYLYPETTVQKDYVCCRQTANANALRKKREAYKALLKGEIRAYKDYLFDAEGAVNSIVRATGQDYDYIYRTYYDTVTSQDTRYNPDPNFNGVQGVYGVLIGWNYLETEQPLKLPEFYDISVYAQALGEIIEEFPDDPFYKELWAYFLENNDQYPNFSEKYKPL